MIYRGIQVSKGRLVRNGQIVRNLQNRPLVVADLHSAMMELPTRFCIVNSLFTIHFTYIASLTKRGCSGHVAGT